MSETIEKLSRPDAASSVAQAVELLEEAQAILARVGLGNLAREVAELRTAASLAGFYCITGESKLVGGPTE